MGRLPYEGVRILEHSATLTGRLVGLLFADQGAEVFVERSVTAAPGEHDAYLDRGKIAVPPAGLAETSSADVIIVDGTAPVRRGPAQIVLRVTAAIPGDESYGHLAADCSEDLLNALVGIFTDMAGTGRLLGRPVIYTPLPICSVYASVHGAIAVGAALVDRERTGAGREIVASRLAGGLSAIGALTLTSTGIPAHLAPASLSVGAPGGLTPVQLQEMVKAATSDSAKELWLVQRRAPLSSPFVAADGRLVLPMVSPNRRLTERFLKALGIWNAALAAGMVNESCYDPGASQYAGRNLADSLSLNSENASTLADLIGSAFARKPAAEWERELCSDGVPVVAIQSWDEWQRDPQAHAAGIFAQVRGRATPQIGRSAWIASAQPYPALESCRRADTLPNRQPPPPSRGGVATKAPLSGFRVIDLCNVIAGPACGRVFVELGATVIKIDPLRPLHSPTVMVTFPGETGVGKRSIILDTESAEGRRILHRLVSGADLVLANKLDHQFTSLGLDRDALAVLNPSAIGVQLSAHRGEKRGPRHDYPGYDPALQGLTGIMVRFGAEGCPAFHGIASCVDYLCGYLGAWAGVTALAARERRQDGRGDWAESSLAAAASLVQLLLQQTPEPATARGARATGRTAGERVYKLSDGWIFAQAPHDLSAELASTTVADALSDLAARGIKAVPVQTMRQLADRHRATPAKTVRFEARERDGWTTECFAPSWFAFDGEPTPRPAAQSRIGADAPAILADLGYSAAEIDRLVASGIVGPTEWFQRARH